MRSKETVKFFGAGVLVYVAMAACGATASDHASSASAPTDASPALLDAIADAIVQPVDSASAATPPTTVTEPCSATLDCGPPAGTQCVGASHSYPGATMIELASVIALGHLASNAPVGYQNMQVSAYVADGAVFAPCKNGVNFDTVTFIRPGG